MNKEITDLCATSNPSILRKTSKEELSNISWKQVHKELTERTQTFLRFIEASVQNPSQARNTNKRSDNLIPPMCDAVCQLISIFSEGMCATRQIKSIILKKGGLKKIGFQRLARIYACMDYKSTNKMFETFAEGFLYVCMVNTIYLLSFVETPRKFIIAELSIRKLGSSSVLIIRLFEFTCLFLFIKCHDCMLA